MKCIELLQALEKQMPLHLAMDWDNAGLLLGRGQKEIQRIFIALDATGEVVEEALKAKADLILTHHPVLFSPVKRLTDETPFGKKLLKLLAADTAVISMHTNYDIAPGCMADLAGDRLDLTHREPLEETGVDEKGENIGVGKVGELQKPLTLSQLAGLVKTRFDLQGLVVFGSQCIQEPVQRVAVSPGSGRGMKAFAIQKGAKVLITGDISHHEGLDAAEEGLCIIDAGHYGLEHIFIRDMEKRVKALDPGIAIRVYGGSNPIKFI